MSAVPVTAWWRRLGAGRLGLARLARITRLARHGHRSLVAGVVVLGLAALTVGLTVVSGALAAVGIVLAVPQTVEAARNLRDARRSDAPGIDRRRALARRMLAVRRSEEMVPSIPGGATIDLDYVAETELVTFRSQDDRVAAFDELVAAIKDTGGPLVLVGAPGAGKTFTARWVVTTLLDQAAVDDGPLAERFLLSRWDGTPLTEWLPREWARRPEYRIGVAEAAELVADPSVVLVLDGLDEVPNAQRQSCADAINAFVDGHPQVRLVVCCRNREYRALAQRIESRRVRWIAPLDMAMVAAFIAEHAPSCWDRVRRALADDQALRSLLNTPLLLVAALRAFRDDPTPLLVGSLPQRQHALWDGYLDRMLGGDPAARRRLEDTAITMAATGTLQLARVPRRLRPFLDHCVARHLLRRSAGGYQCLHRQLLGHLVGRATLPDGRHALRSRLLTKVDSEPQAWNNLAREAVAAGHHDAAIDMSRRALTLAPDNPRYLGDLAFHLMLGWQLDEAVEVARAAETADPSDWRPPSTLAYALFRLGDLEGAAAARRRTWSKGYRLSDDSFLAYVLALQGLHHEADAVLDALRSTCDTTRMDRALALAALGRAGEAADCLFPLEVQQLHVAMLLFTVPAAVARTLVPGAFDLVEPEPGMAQFTIMAADHRRNPWGDYDEILFAFRVRPTGGPTEAMGGFILHRFVNQRFTYDASPSTFAFANTLGAVDVAYRAGDVTFRLSVDGRDTLALCIPRVRPAAPPERIEAVAYSIVGEMPYATTESFDMPAGVVADPATVHVEVGSGPVADMLRSLGLPRAPDYCAWGEDLSLTHHLPRPLDGTGSDWGKRKSPPGS
jgi:Flp pilus assembly protein TadD